jgi:glutathione S-transferase
MLTLYHAPQSRSSRMLWLLEEAGAPFEVKLTDISRMDGSGGADPENPHPDKKVPALVDDGVVITESAAICLYVADKFPDAQLGPRVGDPLRGPYLSWLAYYAGVIEPVVTIEFAQLGNHPLLQRSFRGRHEMNQRVLAALKAGPYLLGAQFSVADLLVGSLGQFEFTRPMLPAGQPVDDYLARLNGRPALARAQRRDATG